MNKNKIGFPLYGIGYIVIIISTLLFIFNDWSWVCYIFAAGAICTIIGRYMTLPQATDFRIRRLNGMLMISAVLILATAYLMYLGKNAWAITLTIAAFIDIYTTFRYPEKK